MYPPPEGARAHGLFVARDVNDVGVVVGTYTDDTGRQSGVLLQGGQYTWSVGALFRAGAFVSRFLDLQIANSERGRAYHVAAGYRTANFIVIPNGIDVERFAPRPELRAEWRARNGDGSARR